MESFDWLPDGFTGWLPSMQAAVLGLATFVQEDVPTVTAALLAGTGRLAWPVAFAGCFLGIWIGDALLYLAARGLGRGWLERGWVRRWISAEAVARSEKWFASEGTWLLVASRFIPGTRLPTYLAAGFLRVPFPRFAAVTGLVVALWTGLIFAGAAVLGERVGTLLGRWDGGGWAILGLALAGCAALRIAPRLVQRGAGHRLRAALGRWTRWEFWPGWLFYLPVGFQYLRLAWRHGGLTTPCAANPGMPNGGLVGESKFTTLADLMATSPEFTAESWLLPAGSIEERLRSLNEIRQLHGLELPFVLKPDVGQRGAGVRVVRVEADVSRCLEAIGSALVVQRYIPGPFELGIFYHRLPGEACGRIFAVTEKVFPTVVGDGVRTLEELVWADPRARFLAHRYLARHPDARERVPAPGESVRLVEAGNHAQGCIFRDGRHLVTPGLEARIDAISRALPGFHVGRFDLRYESPERLQAGQGFWILELNGASAEATSIYDERNPLMSAYRTLFRQWELVFLAGAANRAAGVRCPTVGELWRCWRETDRQVSAYPASD